jgi:hypothetical protein
MYENRVTIKTEIQLIQVMICDFWWGDFRK